MTKLGRKSGSTIGTLLAAALIVPLIAGAATTLPVEEDFESQALGTDLTVTGPWTGNTNAIVVEAGDPGFAFGYPLPSSAHTQVATLSDATLLEFTPDAYTNALRMYVDVMMKPVPRDSAPTIDDTNVKAAVYLSDAGVLNILARTRDTGTMELDPAAGEGSSGKWIELTHTPVQTGEWFRLTMEISYREEKASPPPPVGFEGDYNTQYRVAINGGSWISHTQAWDDLWYDITQQPPTASGNGTWFYAANSGTTLHPTIGTYGAWGLEKTYIVSVATEGPGSIDDFVVSSNAPAASGGSVYGVPLSWYVNNGLTDPDGDEDGDGMLNYEEFWAGTDFNDGASVLEFVVISAGTANQLWWTGDNSTTTTPYQVWVATNLADVSPWTYVADVARVAPGGTNYYEHTTPPPAAVYQVRVPFDNGL